MKSLVSDSLAATIPARDATLLIFNRKGNLRRVLAPKIQIGSQDAEDHQSRSANLAPVPTGARADFIFRRGGLKREVLDGSVLWLRSRVAHGDHHDRGDKRDQHAEVLEIDVIDDPQERTAGISFLKSRQAERDGGVHNHSENS